MRHQSDPQIQVSGLGACRSALVFGGDADARTLGDPRGNADVYRGGLPIMGDRESGHRAGKGVLAAELYFLFDVAARSRSSRPAGAPPRPFVARASAAA